MTRVPVRIFLYYHHSSVDIHPFTATQQILTKATNIERTVFDAEPDVAKYRNKMRSLYLNLKDKANPMLREAVVSGDLSVEKFCVMTSQVRSLAILLLWISDYC